MYDMANGGEYDTPPVMTEQSTTAGEPAQENETMETQTQAAEATEKKTRKAKGKKTPAKKIKAKAKVAKKAGAKKTPAKKGDSSGPRPGTIAAFCVERFAAGDEVADVVKAAVKKFPDSKASEPGYVSWHRWNAKKKGWLK
jgi:hypothetical protein